MAEIDVNGVRTYYEEHGSGVPVILVHGLGGSVEVWRRQIAELAEDFRVIAYDLRGAGRSSVPAGPYTLEQLVADLDGLIEALGLGAVLLVGHSMSGAVVLEYAADQPERVLGVVGIGAVAELPEQGREGMRARAETVEAQGMAAVAETVATNGTAPSFRERDPDGYRTFVALLESNDPAGYAALCRAVAGIDVASDLGRVRAPVLLVAGDRDAVSPPAANDASAARLANVRHVQLEDTAHIVMLERPAELLEAARAFLLEAAAAAAAPS
jgi:3-oxoadipate enol-lactonase